MKGLRIFKIIGLLGLIIGVREVGAMDVKEEWATFAGGCFWCMESAFYDVEGVRDVQVGYMGGMEPHPNYERVSTGKSGYLEVAQVVYDPLKTKYERLLDIFWDNVDPTQGDGQFADRGTQYHTAIFYHSEQQHQIALASKKQREESGSYKKPIVTRVLPAETFYPAEEYHQEYFLKKPLSYQTYKEGSGRAAYIRGRTGKSPRHS